MIQSTQNKQEADYVEFAGIEEQATAEQQIPQTELILTRKKDIQQGELKLTLKKQEVV